MEAGQAWDEPPRSGVYPNTKRRDRLMRRAMGQPTWTLGFGDEVWWSRLAQPNQPGWTAAEATYTWQELTAPTDDPDPKALACYGLLVRLQPRAAAQMWLRCVTGRPVRVVAIELLTWCAARLEAQGFTALVVIWDHAAWHRSHAVRRWLRQHHRQVKRGASGVRLVWSARCPPKVHGSTPLSRNGCMTSGPCRKRSGC